MTSNPNEVQKMVKMLHDKISSLEAQNRTLVDQRDKFETLASQTHERLFQQRLETLKTEQYSATRLREVMEEQQRTNSEWEVKLTSKIKEWGDKHAGTMKAWEDYDSIKQKTWEGILKACNKEWAERLAKERNQWEILLKEKQEQWEKTIEKEGEMWEAAIGKAWELVQKRIEDERREWCDDAEAA